MEPAAMRRLVNGAQPWSVDLAGEGSIDVGGAYRETLTMACQDLMSSNTRLFVPSPNGVNAVGFNREKWVINPACVTSVHMQQFEFLGRIMGMALRTRFALPVDLPSIVWRALLDEEPGLDDLAAFDKLCVQGLESMQALSEEAFTLSGREEMFVTALSDGSVVELIPGGAAIPVTADRRAEFAALVIRTRLHESDAQLRAIRRGFNSVVPLAMLSLFSWWEVEHLVCGNPDIDIDVLKRHAVMRGGYNQQHPVIRSMFAVLKSFTSRERQLFLRFVWGRNRLPPSDSDWTTSFTIAPLAPSAGQSSDAMLPVAHTCFFTLDLPAYSSFEVMRAKLLYAIHNCTAIDADFNPNESAISAWAD
jgi:hypothetical protein